MRRKRFAVIVAAGRGSWRTATDGVPMPKVLETIGKRPIIEHLLRAVRRVQNHGGLDEIIVVINPVNGHLIREHLKPFDVQFAIQPDRLGAADAVKHAIVHRFGSIDLRMREWDFVTLFADMPFWTPRTIENLLDAHQEQRALMTMGTIHLLAWSDPRLDRLLKYGRVIKNDEGRIRYCVEPKVATDYELSSPFISPSLYAFDLGWFAGHATRRHEGDLDFKDARARELNQGEFHLPPFARFAAQEERIDVVDGKIIHIPNPLEFPIDNPYEALGVNTEQELIEARIFWRELGALRRERHRHVQPNP